MTLSLTNASGRCLVFVLAHETYCKARGTCACNMTPGRDPRRIPRSLTLTTGVTLHGVDDAVLAVPDVGRAQKAGRLKVKPLATPPLAAPAGAVPAKGEAR